MLLQQQLLPNMDPSSPERNSAVINLTAFGNANAGSSDNNNSHNDRTNTGSNFTRLFSDTRGREGNKDRSILTSRNKFIIYKTIR